jgi:hypothetical protein
VGLPRILPLFVLPRLPRTATVLGPLDSWRAGLEQARIELTDADPDLVVATAAHAREAVALQPASVVIEGRAPRNALTGYATQTLLPLPGPDEPELLLPAGSRAAVAYALAGHTGLRSRLARPLLARGIVPPPASPTIVAARSSGPPAFVAAAAELLPGPVESWLPVLGAWGDPFSRGVLLLFAPGAATPRWALKFARIPGNSRPFELDERGLAVAAAAGGTVAAHAPRLLGRFSVGALEASLETATQGERMLRLLTGSAGRPEKLAAVERIAGWVEAVARETSGPPTALEAVRANLAARVLPRWPAAPPDLADRLARVPSVVEHGDLWPENVLLDGSSFGLLDWEAARADGLPLWDLLYFLTGALAFVDGADSEAEKEEHFVRLFRGELPSSGVLFDWTRRVVAAAGVPDDAVGPLATLRILWLAGEDLQHSERTAAAGSPIDPLSVRHAERWLADPVLGAGWDRWRR